MTIQNVFLKPLQLHVSFCDSCSQVCLGDEFAALFEGCIELGL